MGMLKKGRLVWVLIVGCCLFAVWLYQEAESKATTVIVDQSAPSKKPVESLKAHGLVQTFSIKEASQKADVIAEVEIVKELEELYEPGHKTIYSAKVIHSLKGNVEDGSTVFVMQDGNSKVMFNDNPQFQSGETFILILMKAVSVDEPDTYWILGAETGVYEVLGDTLVKWSKPEEELKQIEASYSKLKENKSAQSTLSKLKQKDTQLINKQKFEQLLIEQLER